jgi:hypothetical protein
MKIYLAIAASISLGACSFSPYKLGGTDQILGIGPRNPSVLKSLRCEIVTFIVENRLRALYWKYAIPKLEKEIQNQNPIYYDDIAKLKQFPYVDIDGTQYASLQADLKNIDTFTASLGVDWKYIGTPTSHFKDYHVGPSYISRSGQGD